MTEEPGGLQSTGSQRVGHNLVTKHNNKIHVYVCVCAVLCFPLGFPGGSVSKEFTHNSGDPV